MPESCSSPAWFVMVALCVVFATGPFQAQTPLRVEAKVSREAYYVGQAIDVRVGVVAAGERPRITPPRVPGAEIDQVDTSFQQIESSGIGDVVSETNLFVTRFRLVVDHAGPIVVPPFLASVGDRSGTSSPIRLTIQAVPPEGRPPSYLRGVGRIVAKAEATPSSVRLGQTFEYRLILNGPGARGSTQWPQVEAPPGATIEPSTTEVAENPVSRTFRYRVRTSVVGTFTFPSVAVAAFDPVLKRYNETQTPSVQVRVVDVPRFDPKTEEVPNEPSSVDTRWRFGVTIGVVTVGLVVLTLIIQGRRGIAVRNPIPLCREMERLAESLGTTDPSSDLPGTVVRGLTHYLSRTIGRPEGELTPIEAHEAIKRATGDAALAGRVESLLRGADRVRFAGEGSRSIPDPDFTAEAAEVFRALARAKVR